MKTEHRSKNTRMLEEFERGGTKSIMRLPKEAMGADPVPGRKRVEQVFDV